MGEQIMKDWGGDQQHMHIGAYCACYWNCIYTKWGEVAISQLALLNTDTYDAILLSCMWVNTCTACGLVKPPKVGNRSKPASQVLVYTANKPVAQLD